MHFKKNLLPFFIICFLAGCHPAEKPNTPSDSIEKVNSNPTVKKEIESREAFFYRETMDIHNEVMAKMGKLNGYKKKVQQQTDSIKSVLTHTEFPRQMAQRISRDLDSLDVVGKKLAFADSAMNAWMEQFNPDPKLATSDANADYFEKQKQSAEAMKKQFFEALGEAEKKFN